MFRFIEEMTPVAIRRIVSGSGVVFVPVSPLFEWHCWHLPVGTDGLVSESFAREAAQRVGGACFRTMGLALDMFRDEGQKKEWGLPLDAEVFGMNFPGLGFTSEYTDAPIMTRQVTTRVRACRDVGFRYVFILNHHGGKGQMPTLREIAESESRDGFRVESLTTYQFNKYSPPAGSGQELYMKVGGHAGLSETHWVMSVLPDLVQMDNVPDGPLTVPESGILHDQPQIPAEFNPRHARREIAEAVWRSTTENLTEHVRRVIRDRNPGL